MDPQLYGVGRSQKPEPLPTIDSLDKTQCYLDFIQVNVDEARHFLGEDDPYVQVELVVEAFAETCILTLGPHGALIFDGHRFHRVPAYEVMAVDTYGAGSVHLAAFAAGLIQGRSAVESAAVASAAASISVEQSGPMFRIETHEMKRRADEVLDGVVTS